MRPSYETSRDRLNQDFIRGILEEKWKCRLCDMPRNSAVDYVALDNAGTVKALIEVKCRTNPKNQYDSFLLSFHKIESCNAVSKGLCVPTLLVVGWTDEVAFVRLKEPSTYNTKQGGRVDRGDPQDIHTVALIPNEEFTTIINRRPL